MISIKTARLTLRELDPSDAEEIFILNNNPDVIRYTGDAAFNNVDEARNFLIHYDEYRKYNRGRLAMIELQSSQFLGWCGLKYHEDTNLTDLGFRLHKKFWNHGYATEAAKACIDFGFQTLNLPVIIAHAMNDNKASIHVLQKLGMKFKKEFDFDGKKGVFMEISKEEYLKNRESKIS